MPSDYVKTGVWELYGEPFHKRWVWTLEDGTAFLLLGLYGLSLVIVQKRAWSILRGYIALSTKASVSLGDRVNPFRDLSQTEALKDCLAYFQIMAPMCLRKAKALILTPFIKRPVLSEDVLDDGAIPFLFGVLALVNVLLFAAAGVLIPLLLTNGVETPLVRSRWTPLCDRRRFDKFYGLREQTTLHAPSLYELCWDKDNFSLYDKVECVNLAIDNLSIVLANSTNCPLPSNICFADGLLPQTLVIRHHNITLRQLGLNSRSTLTMNHEVSCAPIILEHFIRPLPDGGSVLSFREFSQDIEPKSRFPADPYYLKLETLNGPNKWTSIRSGYLIEVLNSSKIRESVSVLPYGE
ncbi:hypothetical protein ABW19_dt0206596 [Dactylella cylindrospora]|nr:hypothetical protein ABW19_dt0206596 [Dactylella cylindrospora]